MIKLLMQDGTPMSFIMSVVIRSLKVIVITN